MSKKLISGIVVCLLIVAVVSACVTPVSAPPSTTVPTNTPGVTGGVAAPDIGAPTIPPGLPTPAIAPAPAMVVPGGGYTSPTPILNQYQNQNAGILVTGMGQVQATPDIATLTLGVSSQQATVAAAQNNAATAMNAVMKVLKDKGIADADITTVGFNINPVYDYRNNTPTITGYQVTNMITVKIRKISDTSAIIDASATAGGNLIQVNSIGFGVNDPTPYMKQARAAAMADAKDKAGQLATLGGVKLGPPTFITESSGYYPPSPVYYAAGVASAKDIATPISPGETQISVSVTVIYSMQ